MRRSLFAIMLAVLVAGALSAARAADVEIDTAAPAGVDTTKTPFPKLWKLWLPAGFERMISIMSLGDGEYMFKFAGNLSGTYRRDGNMLRMVTPDDPRLTEFAWKIKNAKTLILVEEPPAGKTGASYKGAILKRTDQTQE